MLTKEQKHYLEIVWPEKANSIVRIKPYNPIMPIIASRIIEEIKRQIPEADVRFTGASALEISGQGDIDIYVKINNQQTEQYKNILDKIFLSRSGSQKSQTHLHKWYWYEGGSEVNVYLADKDSKWVKEQMNIFELFKNNPEILKEYETLKASMDNKTWKEYKIVKYEFYNRVLGIKE